jgi:ribosomal protein S5
VIHATIAALKQLRSIEETARLRGKQIEELTA